MGPWIALGILVLLAAIPLGVSLSYNAQGPVAAVVVGPVHIILYPIPQWLKKQLAKEKKPKPPQKTQVPAQSKAPEKSTGSSLEKILPLLKLALDFLGDFRRKLRLDYLRCKLTLAGGDPCDLAVNYGRTWAAVGNLSAQLERIFVIKKRDVAVACDFTAPKTQVDIRLDITITLGRLLSLAVKYGMKALRLLKKPRQTQTEEKAV